MAFSTENWRNFASRTLRRLADCEEGELILTWKNQPNTNTPKVWIDELKVERSSLEVLTWADYYPYGLVMREGTCDSYRYQYQGETAEKDKETGWNHFELREYDPVTGRWLSTDPYGEFWSPYVGMGNDPVNNIDPDGGETDPVDDFIKAGGKVMAPATVTASYTGPNFYNKGIAINTPAVYDLGDNIILSMPKTNFNHPYLVAGREFLLGNTDIQATGGMLIDWAAFGKEHKLWESGKYITKNVGIKAIPTNVNSWSKNLLAINKRNLALFKAGYISMGVGFIYAAADAHKWWFGDKTMNDMTNERYAFKVGVTLLGFVPHLGVKAGVFGVTLIEHWYGDDIERHLRTPNSRVGGSDPLPPWIKK